MATFIPDGILSSLKGCEDKIAQILKKLPDDCLVYHEAAISGRSQADFIVIFPEVGVLVIEAKGWPISDITHADSQNYTHSAFGKNKHPQRQARDYMHLLMERCKKSHFSKFLVAEDGSYKGRFVFPFAYIAAFCNVNREEFEDRFPGVFPNPTNVTKDELQELRNLAGRELVLALKRFFSPVWPIERMSCSQLDAIRAIIHPGSQINDLSVLDVQQEQIAYSFKKSGHRLVYGVAGSGKTVILVARARMLAEKANGRILVLCYNRLLKQRLEQVLDVPNIDIHTFHSWARKNGLAWIDDETKEEHSERFLAHFAAGLAPDAARYDGVLIDEVQYSTRDWLKCASLALAESDPSAAELFIAGDGTQKYFRTRGWPWKEAGVSVVGARTKILEKNYRNTVEILTVAAPFAPSSANATSAEDEMPVSPVEPKAALRHGPIPELVKLQSRFEEADYAASLIETWLRGGVLLRGKREAVSASDIAVIYRRQGRDEADAIAHLLARVGAFSPIVRLTPAAAGINLGNHGVRVLTVESCIGLQFKCLIVIWADQFPQDFGDRDERALFYAGLTRAEEVLAILHSSGSPFTEEIEAAIKRLSAR